VRSTPVHFDGDEFIRVWNESSSTAEVCEKLGIKADCARWRYRRLLATGAKLKMFTSHILLSQDTLERFWDRVNKSDNCWVWTAGKTAAGYGCLRRKQKLLLAHRVSWEFANGPIPDGLEVLHKCDNPSCVRPDHLFLGTQTDNMNDMVSKGRQKKGTSDPNAKLTPEAVRAIIKERSNGSSYSQLAKQFNISSATAYAVVKGRLWKWVER
jgi:hypothetical protein